MKLDLIEYELSDYRLDFFNKITHIKLIPKTIGLSPFWIKNTQKVKELKLYTHRKKLIFKDAILKPREFQSFRKRILMDPLQDKFIMIDNCANNIDFFSMFLVYYKQVTIKHLV